MFFPIRSCFIPVILSFLFSASSWIFPVRAEEALNHSGAFYTNQYSDLFAELLGVDTLQVVQKIDKAWQQLFYGSDENERLYFPVEPDMAYIKDVLHGDVRSEGMSYGLMIAVQLNKKQEFDRLWKWAKTYMQHAEGPRERFFSWHLRPDGSVIDPNSAPDGEEYIVMSLFFAAARWGDGPGVTNYTQEAQFILDAMLSKAENPDSDDVVTNMFKLNNKQVVFVPIGSAADFTDPSYHLPHFYELWSRWADNHNEFWSGAASVSREFLKKTVHPVTGLAPDYANFDGSPREMPWTSRHTDFRFDAWRVGMNIAMDYVWFAADPWEAVQSNRWLDFFYREGIDSYVNQYSLDGHPLSSQRSTGLIAMNAVVCLAATHEKRADFVRALWEMEVPSGMYRYYDGHLYMLALLNVSGHYRIYHLN
jgi:oligosaccharide reducing-end xylanase